MMQSETIGKLADALAKAQGEIKGATKEATNPHFRAKYADLASVWDACREPLSKNGLSVIQTMDGGVEHVEIITTLAHSSGEWIRGRMVLRPVKADPQGIGSACTYGRRYSLAAIVGVAPEDDDGNDASGKGKGNATPPPKADTKRTDPPPPPPEDDPPFEDERDEPKQTPLQAAIAFRDVYVNAAKGAKDMQDLVALAQLHYQRLARLRKAYPALMQEIEQTVAAREAAFRAPERNMIAAG